MSVGERIEIDGVHCILLAYVGKSRIRVQVCDSLQVQTIAIPLALADARERHKAQKRANREKKRAEVLARAVDSKPRDAQTVCRLTNKPHGARPGVKQPASDAVSDEQQGSLGDYPPPVKKSPPQDKGTHGPRDHVWNEKVQLAIEQVKEENSKRSSRSQRKARNDALEDAKRVLEEIRCEIRSGPGIGGLKDEITQMMIYVEKKLLSFKPYYTHEKDAWVIILERLTAAKARAEGQIKRDKESQRVRAEAEELLWRFPVLRQLAIDSIVRDSDDRNTDAKPDNGDTFRT